MLSPTPKLSPKISQISLTFVDVPAKFNCKLNEIANGNPLKPMLVNFNQ